VATTKTFLSEGIETHYSRVQNNRKKVGQFSAKPDAIEHLPDGPRVPQLRPTTVGVAASGLFAFDE
jgi:hypothetical protein